MPDPIFKIPCTCRDVEDSADPACPVHGDPAVNGTADYAKPGDPICAEAGCESALRRYGDQWWHVQPAKVLLGGHPIRPGQEARPMTDNDPWPAVESGPPPARQLECNCYPGGFTGDTYEGPQDDCPVHGRLPAFYLTFFELDAERVNPRFELADPAGYVVLKAESYTAAKTVVDALFGRNWHDLYAGDLFGRDQYPRGELLRIVVPTGLIEEEDHRV